MLLLRNDASLVAEERIEDNCVSFPMRYILRREIVNKSPYISDNNETAYLYLSNGDNSNLFKSKDNSVKDSEKTF